MERTESPPAAFGSKRAQRGFRLLLSLGTALVALIGAEMVARPLYGPGFLSLVDPLEHHPFRPFARVEDVSTGAPFVTNSLGWKDLSQRTVKTQPAKPRVVVLGDSFAEGLGLAAADGTPLARRDGLASAPLRFLYNHLALLRLARRAQLRLLGRALAPGEAAHGATAAVLSAEDRLALAAPTLSFERYQTLSTAARVVLRSNWIDHGPSRAGWARHGMASVEANLSRIRRQCDARSMGMILLLYPDPLALYTDRAQWPSWRATHPRWFGERAQLLADTPGDGAMAFRAPLIAWAEREGVPVVDLWPHFLGRADGPSFFLPDDVHFNAAGAREVAHLLAPHVASRLATAEGSV